MHIFQKHGNRNQSRATIPRIFLAFSLTLLAQSLFTCSVFPRNDPPIPTFSAQNAYRFLLKQCDFGPRNPGSPGYHQCREYLINTLKEFADQVVTQDFPLSFGSPQTTMNATNIIAKFQPNKTSRILLCAHWDTRPWADEDPNPQNHTKPILGANDGASGVAVLLEIAHLLHRNKSRFGVDIVFFDGEDAGIKDSDHRWIQGSAFFAKNLDSEYRPRFGVLLDMIGDADLTIYKEAHSWWYARSVVERVWKRAASLGLSAFKPEVKYAVLDDHIPLLESGIPCIDLIDLDYPYWHTMDDTPDKCSASSLGMTGKLLIDLIYENGYLNDK